MTTKPTRKPPLPKQAPATASALFPSPYLKADDLPSGGVTVRISAYRFDWLRPKDEWEYKMLIAFSTPNMQPFGTYTTPEGKTARKALIINQTHVKALAQIIGSEVFDQWRGAIVQLSPAQTNRGDDTIAISRAHVAEPATNTELRQAVSDADALWGEGEEKF